MSVTFLDYRVQEALERGGIDVLVPWYLIASLLYYHTDISVISDGLYDEITKNLNNYWSELRHPHKSLLDRKMLVAGTGFSLVMSDYPSITISSAIRLAIEIGASDLEVASLRDHLRERLS